MSNDKQNKKALNEFFDTEVKDPVDVVMGGYTFRDCKVEVEEVAEGLAFLSVRMVVNQERRDEA